MRSGCSSLTRNNRWACLWAKPKDTVGEIWAIWTCKVLECKVVLTWSDYGTLWIDISSIPTNMKNCTTAGKRLVIGFKRFVLSMHTPEVWHSFGRVNMGIAVTYTFIGIMFEVKFMPGCFCMVLVYFS